MTPGSVIVGRSAAELRLGEHGVDLIALSRRDEPVASRLRRVTFAAGDLLLLRAGSDGLAAELTRLGCLPLAGRQLSLDRPRRRFVVPVVLAGAMAVAGSGLAPVSVAFFGGAVLVLLLGALPLRDAYERVDWPILILLGALIPVSDAMRTTGGSDLVAAWLSVVAISLPPIAALALVMAAAMAVTPFLNNAATVLVMAPVGVSLAARLDLAPGPFLMAVAIRAACDFLTSIGHQCNTLVMGPGGYRFGDYARLGAPLSLGVIALRTPLIAWFWPLA